MATIEELEAGLRKAHAAGQTEHARRFAAEIRRMRGAQQPKADFSGVSARVIGRPLEVSDEQRNQVLREFGATPSQRSGLYERYMAGVGKSMVDTVQGIGQAITDQGMRGAGVAEDIASLVNPEAARQVGDRLRGFQSGQRESVARRRQTDPAFSEDPVFGFGNVVGALGQLLIPGTAARGTMVGRAALPTTVKGNALQGMAFGSVQPVAGEGEREVNTALGGTFGGVLPAASKFTTGLLRMAGNALGRGTVSGSTKRAAEILRAEASGLPGLLRPAPSTVPGVRRSLAEESLDPGIARLERNMRSQTNLFDPIDRANNAARVASLQKIAGTDADMAAAIDARSAMGRSARQDAMSAGDVDISETLSLLDDAIKGQEGRPAVRAGLQTLKSLLATESEEAPGLVTTTPESRMYVLDNVRETIGDMLSGKYGGDNAAALKGSRELLGIRDSLNEEIASQVPRFADYLNAYRQGSIPINRMEIGRELLDRGAGSAIADPVTGVRPLTPAALSRQAIDLDSVAARATGFSKAKAADSLTKQDIAAIRAIQDDLERQSFRATAGSGGNSQTFERLMLQDKMSNRLASRIPVAGGFIEAMSKMADQRVNDKLARLLADPAQARAVLNQLNARDRAAVSKALVQLSGATGSSVPALTE